MFLKRNRVIIFDLPVDVLTMKQTLTLIDKSIIEGKQIHHVVVNAAKIVHAQKNIELRESIISCDIINADGQAVVWASKLLNKPLPERVAGIDLMEEMVKLASKRGYRIFFLGAKEKVVKKVVKKYSQIYGSKLIAGYRNGYFLAKERESVAIQIFESKPDILFVAISSPIKEVFLNEYKSLIEAPFIMGVGGSFDVVSGIVKRAPKWMQNSGLEWLFRVYQEPGRMWKRYLTTNLTFMKMCIQEKIRK